MHTAWIKDEPAKAGKYVFYDAFVFGSVTPSPRQKIEFGALRH